MFVSILHDSSLIATNTPLHVVIHVAKGSFNFSINGHLIAGGTDPRAVFQTSPRGLSVHFYNGTISNIAVRTTP